MYRKGAVSTRRAVQTERRFPRHLLFGRARGDAVHRHAPARDGGSGLAARDQPAGGEQLVEPLGSVFTILHEKRRLSLQIGIDGMVQLQHLGENRQQHGRGQNDEHEGDEKADRHAA